MKAFLWGLAGCLLHLLVGAAISLVLVDFLDDRLYAGYTLLFMAPCSAIACGVAGINCGVLCHQGEWQRAARCSAIACALVAAAVLTILVAGGAPHWSPLDQAPGR